MDVLATDNFNRANETPIAAPWQSTGGATGKPNLSGNKWVPAASGEDNWSIYYGRGNWPRNQYSQAVLSLTSGPSSDEGIGLLVRGSIQTTQHFYRVIFSTPLDNQLQVKKFVNGTGTVLLAAPITWVNGDTLKAEVIGQNIKVYRNGSQVGSTVTDSTHSVGNPGISMSSTATGASADDWEGGGDVTLGNLIREGARPAPFKAGLAR